MDRWDMVIDPEKQEKISEVKVSVTKTVKEVWHGRVQTLCDSCQGRHRPGVLPEKCETGMYHGQPILTCPWYPRGPPNSNTTIPSSGTIHGVFPSASFRRSL